MKEKRPIVELKKKTESKKEEVKRKISVREKELFEEFDIEDETKRWFKVYKKMNKDPKGKHLKGKKEALNSILDKIDDIRGKKLYWAFKSSVGMGSETKAHFLTKLRGAVFLRDIGCQYVGIEVKGWDVVGIKLDRLKFADPVNPDKVNIYGIDSKVSRSDFFNLVRDEDDIRSIRERFDYFYIAVPEQGIVEGSDIPKRFGLVKLNSDRRRILKQPTKFKKGWKRYAESSDKSAKELEKSHIKSLRLSISQKNTYQTGDLLNMYLRVKEEDES